MSGAGERTSSRRAVLGGLAAVVGAGSALSGCSGAGASGRATSSTTAVPRPEAPSAPTPSTTSSPAPTQPDPSTPTPSAAAPSAAAPSATVPGPGPDITAGPADVPALSLTFHGAGDPAITRDVIAELAAAGARVTVMAIGTWLAEDPGTAKALLDAGHELGNHTWSHPTLPRLAPGAIADEITRGAAELKTLTGTQGRWFRPSGTQHSDDAIRAAATAAGYGACLSYDVDPMDYADPGAALIEQRLLSAAVPGAIVSLHLGHAGTRDALPAVLDGLRGRGLSAVSVSRLLGVA